MNASDATTHTISHPIAAHCAMTNFDCTVTYRRPEGSPTKSGTGRSWGIGYDALDRNSLGPWAASGWVIGG
jgi:hypothetical protein